MTKTTSPDLRQPKPKIPYTPYTEPKPTEVFTHEGELIQIEDIEIETPSVTDADLVPDETEFSTMTDGLEGQNSGYDPTTSQESQDNPATGFQLSQIMGNGEISKLMPFVVIGGLLYIGINKILLLGVTVGILFLWKPKGTPSDVAGSLYEPTTLSESPKESDESMV